jgi:RNA polymerase sigma-70 factor (ECF subfamily)
VEDDVLTRLDSGEADRYEDFDLKNALDQLPEKYRTVIVLRFFEDLKIEEIAEVLDENANTIKTRLYTSLNKLRLTLGDNGTEV